MNPTRKRRLVVISLILGAVGIAATLTVFALQQNITYLYTPVEVLAGKVPPDSLFRLGGMVKAGSIQRASDSLKTGFTVTDGDADMSVEYTGILPDLFREKQSVIATGTMENGRFVASKLLAKHDENYVPRDVAEAMANAHKKHQVPEGKAAAQ